MVKAISVLLISACVLAKAYPQNATDSNQQVHIRRFEVTISMPEAGKDGLKGLLVFSDLPQKHPLVIITPGSSALKSTNRESGPGSMQPLALWFARRGWAALVVERRGYGGSGGEMEKAHGLCRQSLMLEAADENVKDLTTAYNAIRNHPQIDSSRVIVAGQSAGGFAALALGAHAFPELKAVINFTGGWHSSLFNGTCVKHALAPAFAEFGKTTHLPELWLYAKNDSFNPPKIVAEIEQAFTSTGGIAEVPVLGNSGQEGHYMYAENEAMWAPLVEEFLARHDLPAKNLDTSPREADLKLPENAPREMQEAFSKFLKYGPYKAFAVGPDGRWAYISGRKTPKIAADIALDRCGSAACKVIYADQ